MPKTLQTTLTWYRFDIGDPLQEKEYHSLMKKLRSKRGRGKKMEVYAHGKEKMPETGPIVLETEYLFDNQWNSAPSADSENGYRVFDHYEYIFPNYDIKHGYYLEMTQEMRDVRDNTMKCGYCGNQEPASEGLVFCYKCLDSVHLKEKDLFLLRLLPCSARFGTKREPLSDAEKAHLLPQYIERQTRSKDSRAVAHRAEQRARIIAKRDKTMFTAKTEADGLLWLLDRNLSIDNVIYYAHRDRFCFGWRQKVSESVKSEILNVISEFPFNYEILTENGVLSN